MAAAKPVRAMRFDRLKVFTGNANPALAAKICGALGCTLGASSVKPFSDGEIQLQIEENVRGADVFVVQPTCTPVDRHLMELLLMIDALKRASAERITAVLPYYGYARQDRKDRPRMPISARLVANLIQTAGADRVLTLDLHAAQIQGFFDVPVDHSVFRSGDDRVFRFHRAPGYDGGFARRRRRGARPGFCEKIERSPWRSSISAART